MKQKATRAKVCDDCRKRRVRCPNDPNQIGPCLNCERRKQTCVYTSTPPSPIFIIQLLDRNDPDPAWQEQNMNGNGPSSQNAWQASGRHTVQWYYGSAAAIHATEYPLPAPSPFNPLVDYSLPEVVPQPSIPFPNVQPYADPPLPQTQTNPLANSYERLSNILFALHRERVMLEKSAPELYCPEELFHAVSALCDAIQESFPFGIITPVPQADFGSPEWNAPGLFRLACMAVALVVDIYNTMIQLPNRATIEPGQAGLAPDRSFGANDPNTGYKAQMPLKSHTRPGSPGHTMAVLRYTMMDFHLSKLKLIIDLSSNHPHLDWKTSAQLNETNHLLVMLWTSVKLCMQPQS